MQVTQIVFTKTIVRKKFNHFVFVFFAIVGVLGFDANCNLVLGKPPVLTVKELVSPPPKIIRTCCAFGADVGVAHIPFVKKTDITSYHHLGNHAFMGKGNEGNGIIYTQKGGFIDIGHVRDCADWTGYLYSLMISKNKTDSILSLDLGIEGGNKSLIIKNFQHLDSLKMIELAGKIAYDLSLWHEIATWYGASFIPMIPERYSSFSPEDLYSNLLGVKLGMKAIMSSKNFNEAMTTLLNEMLDSLGPVSTEDETLKAMQTVEEIWWTKKKSLPSSKVLMARYFDSDSTLTPWILPNDSQEATYILSKLDSSLSDYYTLSIEVNRRFNEICSDQSREKKIVTQQDFMWFVQCVEADQRILTKDVDTKPTRIISRKEKRQKKLSDG